MLFSYLQDVFAELCDVHCCCLLPIIYPSATHFCCQWLPIHDVGNMNGNAEIHCCPTLFRHCCRCFRLLSSMVWAKKKETKTHVYAYIHKKRLRGYRQQQSETYQGRTRLVSHCIHGKQKSLPNCFLLFPAIALGNSIGSRKTLGLPTVFRFCFSCFPFLY